MTLEQALLAAVSALWLRNAHHVRRMEQRVDACETERLAMRKELDAAVKEMAELKNVFLRASCGIFGCDVRQKISFNEAQKRIADMEKGDDYEKDRRK